MKEAMVTILMPCYNHRDYIEMAISSVFAQTYTNFELIVVDDGSTDNSNSVIKQLSTLYKFRHITKENTGLVSTLNEMSTYISGKYVCVLASDDYWPNEKLAEQVEIMEKDGSIAVLCGRYTVVDARSEVVEEFWPYQTAKKLAFEEVLKDNRIGAVTCMIRTRVLAQSGYWNPKFFFEDWPLWLKLLRSGKKICYFPLNWGYYRRHGSNLTSNSLLMYLEMLKVLLQLPKSKIISSEIEKCLAGLSLEARKSVSRIS